MIGRYIILYHFHIFTQIHILTIFFSYIRKIQDTDDWTLMAVLLLGSFTSIFDKTRNMLLYINTFELKRTEHSYRGRSHLQFYTVVKKSSSASGGAG